MRKIFIVFLVIIFVSGVVVILSKKTKVQQFEEIKVIRGDLVSSFRISGTVEPRNRLPIKPQVAGRIEEILVSEGERVKKGQILAWLSSSERAALLDIAKSQGEQEYQKWLEVYKPTPIIAPLDGFIIVRDKEPGQMINTSDYVVVMADELIIKAYVDETDLRYIKLGQVVRCSLDAYPDVKFLGKIEHVAYESTSINNVTVYEVKIKPILSEKEINFSLWRENRKEKYFRDKMDKKLPQRNIASILRSGMTTTIEVIAGERKNVLILPTTAIQDMGKEKFVWIKKDKKILKQPVEVGISDGKNVEIILGLNEGDIVLKPQILKDKKIFSSQMNIRGPMGNFFRR